jgi:hypothetical protein
MEATEVRHALVAACPELAGPLADNDANPGNQGLPYVEMSAIATHLGAKLREGETDCFRPLFAAIEQCLLDGDNATIELVMVGLLEDLQNANITEVPDFSLWEPNLGPVSQRAWTAVAEFWAGDTTAIGRFRVT